MSWRFGGQAMAFVFCAVVWSLAALIVADLSW